MKRLNAEETFKPHHRERQFELWHKRREAKKKKMSEDKKTALQRMQRRQHNFQSAKEGARNG